MHRPREAMALRRQAAERRAVRALDGWGRRGASARRAAASSLGVHSANSGRSPIRLIYPRPGLRGKQTPTSPTSHWNGSVSPTPRRNRSGCHRPLPPLFRYVGVTLYESLVPGTVEYQSLGGQLNGLGVVPAARHGQFHWPAVANAALPAIMRRTYGSAESQDMIANLEAEALAGFQAPPGIVIVSSRHGQKVADFIHDWSTRDGFSEYHNCRYTPPTGEGLWQPTPPGFLNAAEPCWGRVRPFALPSAGACAADPPPAYSSDPSSPFFLEAMKVYATVESLTPEQMAVAAFWSDDPGATGTPPCHSIMIAAQVIEQQDLPLDIAAETFVERVMQYGRCAAHATSSGATTTSSSSRAGTHTARWSS
jgi:hypothetical protein